MLQNGFIALRPKGYRIWENIQDILDIEFKKEEIENAFLPILIPESLLGKESKHFAGFNPEVFWVTHAGDNKTEEKLALRPTSETIAYDFYSRWIKSWRDLPLKINFWNSALRAEIKSTKPLIRNSEFLWQEGHTVHTTQEDAEKQVDTMLEIYKKISDEILCVPVIHGKKSDKEKFVGAEYTKTIEGIMPDGKALQMGTSHFLGTNFSKPYDVKFLNKHDQEEFAWQTSWGASWRLLGAIIMTHGDDNGLIIPPILAPLHVVIIPIFKSKLDEEMRKKITNVCKFLEKALKEKFLGSGNETEDDMLYKPEIQLKVEIDNRDNLTPGEKFNEWDLKGIPLKIQIGEKEINHKPDPLCFLKFRTKQWQESYPMPNEANQKNFVLFIRHKLFHDFPERLKQDSKKILSDNTRFAENMDEFKVELEKGGFVISPWCGEQSCEVKIKDATGAEIRVISEDDHKIVREMHKMNPIDTFEKCIVCSNPKKYEPYFARGY